MRDPHVPTINFPDNLIINFSTICIFYRDERPINHQLANSLENSFYTMKNNSIRQFIHRCKHELHKIEVRGNKRVNLVAAFRQSIIDAH